MDNRLYEFLLKLPKRNLINLMWSSLDEMETYNGRSKTYCIALSLGCEPDDPDDPRKYSLPPLSEAKKNTDEMCPF